jgi:hypothetical protein
MKRSPPGRPAVVFRNADFLDTRATALPGASHPCHVRRGILRQGRQHHVASPKQFGERRLRAAVLGTRNGVPGYELPDAIPERRARGGDNVVLGTPRIGDQSGRPQMRRELAQHRLGLRHGDRNQNQVGVREGRCLQGADRVDNAQLACALQRTGTPAHAYDVVHGAGRLQCQRKRPADQADADDD